MLRVLVTADSQPGAVPYSFELARGLAGLGIETIIALTGAAISEARRAEASAIDGLEIVDTGLSLSWQSDRASLLEAGEAVSALAAERGVDVVHLNTPALAAAARFGVPVVAVQHNCIAAWWEAVHGDELPAAMARRMQMVRAGLQAADIVVAPTAAFSAATKRTYGLDRPPRTVHYGRCPLPVPLYAPHDFVFTSGPLWDEGRNLGMLDAAAAQIDVPVRAAGPIEAPNGVSVIFDNIHCVGNLGEAELARWLSARPVFVSAALYDPFGLTVLDAAAAGCPLILSDIPAYRELWDEVAVFVPARDEQGFTRAIARLVADDFERAVIGRAAKERAALYSPDAMAAQMAAIYRGLLPAVHRPILAAARAAA